MLTNQLLCYTLISRVNTAVLRRMGIMLRPAHILLHVAAQAVPNRDALEERLAHLNETGYGRRADEERALATENVEAFEAHLAARTQEALPQQEDVLPTALAIIQACCQGWFPRWPNNAIHWLMNHGITQSQVEGLINSAMDLEEDTGWHIAPDIEPDPDSLGIMVINYQLAFEQIIQDNAEANEANEAAMWMLSTRLSQAQGEVKALVAGRTQGKRETADLRSQLERVSQAAENAQAAYNQAWDMMHNPPTCGVCGSNMIPGREQEHICPSGTKCPGCGQIMKSSREHICPKNKAKAAEDQPEAEVESEAQPEPEQDEQPDPEEPADEQEPDEDDES